MPELPEVETIARFLRTGKPGIPAVLGRRIEDVQILWTRSIAEPSWEEFKERAIGQAITEIGRRGKYLRIRLTNDVLLIHLRMSGDLVVEPASQPMKSHYRVVFGFDEGLRMAFEDARKFGRVWLTRKEGSVLDKLGPEPLSDAFTPEWFAEALHSHRRQLKPLLLEQSFIAGLGNIYTDEALHLAQLHPLTISATLTEIQVEKLWRAIRDALKEGIQRNGASIDWVYRGGDFQRYFRVYQRTEQACKTCGTPIQRIVVGQRGTYFCPVCQPSGSSSG